MPIEMKKSISHWWLGLVVSAGCIFVYLLFQNGFSMQSYQQFSFLSQSFLQGSLAFTQSYDGWWHDAVLVNGQHYWPLGPLPAIFLMPFQLVANMNHAIFFQGYLQPFLVLLTFGVIYKIAKKLKFSVLDRLYLSFGFIAASNYIGVALWPNAWFFAQVIATLLMCLALLEYVGRKRYWLIGILFGLVFTTRLTASLGVLFFALDVLFDRSTSHEQKLQKLFQLGIGMAPFVFLIGLYNVARFGSFFEQGYSYQNVAGVFGYVSSYGLFNPRYILANLYYMFIAPPVPVLSPQGNAILLPPYLKADPWGMGMVFVAPVLFFTLLQAKWRTTKHVLLLITACIITIPIVFYYGIGWYQFGYRYALDFLPFLYLALMYNLKSLSNKFKILILISAIINMYLFSTIFIL